LLGGRVGYDLFFPPGDVAALADRLRQVLAKPQHYRQVAARTQEYVRAEFSWSTVADRTEEVYRAVLAGKPTPT
jgi:starch synthase